MLNFSKRVISLSQSFSRISIEDEQYAALTNYLEKGVYILMVLVKGRSTPYEDS